MPQYYLCELFKLRFYFFIGWSAEKFMHYLKTVHAYDTDRRHFGGSCVEMFDELGPLYLIWVRDSEVKNGNACLVHECVHAAMKGLDSRGVKITADNDEPLAYLVEHLYRVATQKKPRKKRT